MEQYIYHNENYGREINLHIWNVGGVTTQKVNNGDITSTKMTNASQIAHRAWVYATKTKSVRV